MSHFIFETLHFKSAMLLIAITAFSTNCGEIAEEKASENTPAVAFTVLDTDFSKGRLGYKQQVTADDLVRLHGHLCDGLIEGARALEYGLSHLYPDDIIDRTATRIVSRSSPCLADAALLLTGARYQYGTFWVSDDISGLYIAGIVDRPEAYVIRRKEGVKPAIIDELGELAIQGRLSPCGLDSLRRLEDVYAQTLLEAPDLSRLFEVEQIDNFSWDVPLRNDFLKTDILNKHASPCR